MDKGSSRIEVSRRSSIAAAERILRAGGICRISAGDQTTRILSADGLDPDLLGAYLARDGAWLVVTGTRAQGLGLVTAASSIVRLHFDARPSATVCTLLSNPYLRSRDPNLLAGVTLTLADDAERAAIRLAKRAGMLPAIVVLESEGGSDIEIEAEAIDAQYLDDVQYLEPVVETRVPIAATERARMVVFRSPASAHEHVALVIGEPEEVEAPICRLHSECLTGDVFGSMRCDCGDQLDGAIYKMAAEGDGVLLYLRQEGRGIGLINKMRAYRLQDQGLDTIDANTHLGFDADERDFAIAAQMLKKLGLTRIRLLTNNPEKLAVLAEQGIDIVERVQHSFAANHHNRAYLETKSQRSGHLLRVIEGGLKIEGTGS